MCVERRRQVWCVILDESVVPINPIRFQTEPRPLKVISDIDDTFRSSLKDYSFPSGTSEFATTHYEFIPISLSIVLIWQSIPLFAGSSMRFVALVAISYS